MHMSRKNHRVVDGKLLQMDKRFSDLKEKQKARIAEWFYTAYREYCLQAGHPPDNEADKRILDSVSGQIADAGIWIPYRELVSYYGRRKNKLKKRLEKETDT